jgi:hypothetical protein
MPAKTMNRQEATRAPKPLRVGGKLMAYAEVTDDGRDWYIGCIVDGDQGYRPVSDYGPYDEARARGVVERLNERIHVSPKLATEIVARSMRKSALKGA